MEHFWLYFTIFVMPILGYVGLKYLPTIGEEKVKKQGRGLLAAIFHPYLY